MSTSPDLPSRSGHAMYVFENDAELSLAVWCFDKPTAADWELHFMHLRELTTWRPRNGLRTAALLIPGGFDIPDTAQRNTLTQLTQSPGYDPYVAFVAPNKAVQTVLQLFSLFQRTPKYETKYVANAQEGITWLCERRGGPLPRLEEMVKNVAGKMPHLKRIA